MYYMRMVAGSKHDSRVLVRRLEAEMEERGINQEELAERLGISQGHLSKILSGAVRPGAERQRRRAILWGHPRKGGERPIDGIGCR
jgi:hypothetical protein